MPALFPVALARREDRRLLHRPRRPRAHSLRVLRGQVRKTRGGEITRDEARRVAANIAQAAGASTLALILTVATLTVWLASPLVGAPYRASRAGPMTGATIRSISIKHKVYLNLPHSVCCLNIMRFGPPPRAPPSTPAPRTSKKLEHFPEHAPKLLDGAWSLPSI